MDQHNLCVSVYADVRGCDPVRAPFMHVRPLNIYVCV